MTFQSCLTSPGYTCYAKSEEELCSRMKEFPVRINHISTHNRTSLMRMALHSPLPAKTSRAISSRCRNDHDTPCPSPSSISENGSLISRPGFKDASHSTFNDKSTGGLSPSSPGFSDPSPVKIEEEADEECAASPSSDFEMPEEYETSPTGSAFKLMSSLKSDDEEQQYKQSFPLSPDPQLNENERRVAKEDVSQDVYICTIQESPPRTLESVVCDSSYETFSLPTLFSVACSEDTEVLNDPEIESAEMPSLESVEQPEGVERQCSSFDILEFIDRSLCYIIGG